MTTTKNELWKILEHKFCVDLKKEFSNKNIKGWLDHFVPNEKINVYQHEKGTTTKIYTGNLLNSILHGRIPAKLMAKIYFQKLAKQNYSHSDIELLGICPNPKNEKSAKVQIRFLRYNTSGKMYESAIGIYSLSKIENLWLINEMSVYDDNETSIATLELNKMWFPGKENNA